MFEHEKLKVYGVAREFLPIADRMVARLPAGARETGRQLGRAAESILRNLGEGANRRHPLEKAKFIDTIALRGQAPAAEVAAALDLLRQIARMCAGLERSMLERAE